MRGRTREEIADILMCVTPETLLEAMGIDNLYEKAPDKRAGIVVRPRALTKEEQATIATWFDPLMRRSAIAASRIIPRPYRPTRPVSQREVHRYIHRLVDCRDRFARRAWKLIAQFQSRRAA